MLSVTNSGISHEQQIFDTIESLGFGDLHIKRCEQTGLIALIAIHNTYLGPALGGCRFVPYPDFNSATIDALHLAQGMSFKAAISGLPHGGGKAVIMAPLDLKNRQELFMRFGEFVEELGGRYITAEDSGVTVEDMDVIHTKTCYVTGYSNPDYVNPDPSPLTALGVLRGMQAAVEHKLKRSSLDGIHIGVQGLGKVGASLCRQLHQLGARLTVADIDVTRVKDLLINCPAEVVSTHEIHKIKCDIYAPCALSFAINTTTINEIQASIIAGSANNQLQHRSLGQQLWDKGILYAPDYAINAGGLIQVSTQYAKSSEAEAKIKIESIYDTMMNIFKASEMQNKPTHWVADQIALERMNAARQNNI